ncbi:hypothetical protein V6N13_091633 [Hibiscus sabdariffa]|uniref:Uncharacterized protein n=1 Tax=Hibiscus sabdariffa TaxID=183260 RepID=A0ABR2QEI5_9ROSI
MIFYESKGILLRSVLFGGVCFIVLLIRNYIIHINNLAQQTTEDEGDVRLDGNEADARINVIDVAPPPAAEIELLEYLLRAEEQEIELFKYRAITEEQAIQIVILQRQIQGYQQKEKEKAVITAKLEEQNLLLSERISALDVIRADLCFGSRINRTSSSPEDPTASIPFRLNSDPSHLVSYGSPISPIHFFSFFRQPFPFWNFV